MSRSRVSMGQVAPELYQAVLGMEELIMKRADAAGLEKGFTHLLKLRASQINGCAFCVRMHTRDALAAGESSDRISVLPAWPETSYFTDAEEAALELIEGITLISDEQLPDELYDEVAEILSDEQIAAIEWIGISINTWNRIGIASRIPVGPEQ